MPTWFETGFDLVQQFTGIGGGAERALVTFGVAAIFWALLAVMARTETSKWVFPHWRLLSLGFTVVLSRELVMLAVKVTEAYGWLTPQQLDVVFPPLEHALSNLGLAIIAGVYAWQLTGDDRWLSVIRKSIVGFSVLYVATAIWWGPAVWANPGLEFGQVWTGWVFHVTATVMIGAPLVVLFLTPPTTNRTLVAVALALFTSDELLKLADMALSERFEPVFATVRHTLYLSALAVLTYAYIREHSQTLTRSLNLLQERVESRSSDLARVTSQLESATDRLAHQSRIDVLTGIANRSAFDEECTTEWARGRRNALPLSLLVVDIDYFKGINDGFGHAVGDELLRRAAATIVEATGRSADVVARFGGDEFAVLLPDTDVAGTAAVAKRIVEAIRAIRLESIAETRVTASVGGATLVPTDTVDTSALLLAADEALCIVKDAGRNGLHIVDRRRSLPV